MTGVQMTFLYSNRKKIQVWDWGVILKEMFVFLKTEFLSFVIGLFEMSREQESGVALYTRKVLIKSRTDNILPKWLRFVKGNLILN